VRITVSSLFFAAVLAAAFVPAAPSARAQDCPGDPGYVLDLPDTVPLGSQFTIGLTAPGGSVAFLVVGAFDGSIPTKFGTICVGMPFIVVYAIPIPPEGTLVLPHNVPCDPVLDGMTGIFQFVGIGPAAGQAGLSNSQHLTAVDDGSCGGIETGDFATFTQGGWGAACNGNNVACLRDEFFPTVLPNGLLLGDQGGIDGDEFYALLLTSSLAVENFLPDGGPPSTFDMDEVDVANATAGVFAGQLAAAKLNVFFDDAGIFDALKSQTAVKLGDLVFVDGVAAPLLGLTVREVIDLSDGAISGELPEPIDVDGDTVGDVTLADLSAALDAVNNNFDNGTQNNGVLGLP